MEHEWCKSTRTTDAAIKIEGWLIEVNFWSTTKWALKSHPR